MKSSGTQHLFFPDKYSLAQLPSEPGIYKMKSQDQEVIYVGKAKNLKKRVSSYFQKNHKDIKTQLLVSHIAMIEIIISRSEQEALLLEKQLIKTIKPKYNVALKDDKNFPYIKITNEVFPRILIVRERLRDRATYFGPYTSLGSTRRLQRTLNDLFPIRDCPQPIDLHRKQPKCINLDIEKCIGPCVYKDTKTEYEHLIKQLKVLLSGGNKRLLRQLKTEMQEASDTLRFEKAAKIRDRIEKLNRLFESQTVVGVPGKNMQIWASAENENIRYVTVQTVLDGKLMYQQGFYVDNRQEQGKEVSEEAVIHQAFINVLDNSDVVPDEILCDDVCEDIFKNILNWAEKTRSIKLHRPQKGEKHDLLELAKKNARVALIRLKKDSEVLIKNTFSDFGPAMKEALHLDNIPKNIMGFDASHLYGQNIVASSVYFKLGKPFPSGYRHLKIRSVKSKSNDPASLYEAVTRRLRRCIDDGEILPDLLLIDGGKGQLNAALQAVDDLGSAQHVDVLSLAKKNEEIYSPKVKDTIKLKRHDPALKLCQHIRDEAHRFAVTFQRKQRKSLTNSVLLGIEGLGPKRINLIYKKYKTLDELKKVRPEELAKVGNMGTTLAHRIISHVQHVLNEDPN